MEKSTQMFTIIKPKEGFFLCICLSVILIDSDFKTGKNYYTQMFQKNVDILLKKKRCLNIFLTKQKFLLIILINSDREDFYKENSDKEKSDEEILMKKIKIRI